MHGFSRPLGLAVLGVKIGEGVVRYWPQRTRFHFWGSYVCSNFGENRSRNATVRVLADGQTDRLTDWQTQTQFIICPMLYAIAPYITYIYILYIKLYWWFSKILTYKHSVVVSYFKNHIRAERRGFKVDAVDDVKVWWLRCVVERHG